MQRLMIVVGILIAVAAGCAAPLRAQWLKYPTPGIPRTADGTLNVSAPPPRTPDGKPDLSGLWRMDPGGYIIDIAADLNPTEIAPWAETAYREHLDRLGRDDPATFQCLPPGPAAHFNLNVGSAKIIQTASLIVILYESLAYRQIFLDGRRLENDPNPSFMGYSVGHWDGDTLVVESNGFNGRTWLDQGGRPHTEALRLEERFRRPAFGRLEIQETVTDPNAFTKPFTVGFKADLIPDAELLEYVCNENEKDRAHLVATASDDKKHAVHVARDVLSRYVGTYVAHFPDTDAVTWEWNVTLAGDELFLDRASKGRMAMIPVAENVFSVFGDRMTFVTNKRGAVTHISMFVAEGEIRASRKVVGK